VNSDVQRALKGSKEFQKEEERLFIVQNIKAVDKAIISIDLYVRLYAPFLKPMVLNMILVLLMEVIKIITLFQKPQFAKN
jgi:hypothetical protein